METKIIGKDLEVSALGLGCMGMSHAYGEAVDQKTANEIISAAIDFGYTHFDTAEAYGTAENPHHNEELLGNALKNYRDKVVIATKCGLVLDTTADTTPLPFILDASPAAIRESLEGSLRRLKTDYIDLYYLHRIDPKTPVEVVAETMAELIKEGKITHWGMSEAPEEDIRKAHTICPLTAIQNRYSMMARWHEKLFPTLEELGIGLVAFSPLANGFLSDATKTATQFDKATDYRSAMPQYSAEGIAANQQLLSLIRDLASQHNATPAQISLAWMLCKKPWITAIPGTRKISRLKENAGAADIHLSPETVAEIDRLLDKTEMSQVFGYNR